MWPIGVVESEGLLVSILGVSDGGHIPLHGNDTWWTSSEFTLKIHPVNIVLRDISLWVQKAYIDICVYVCLSEAAWIRHSLEHE